MILYHTTIINRKKCLPSIRNTGLLTATDLSNSVFVMTSPTKSMSKVHVIKTTLAYLRPQ